MRRLLGNGAPPPDKYDLRTINIAGEEIPAYALVQVSDASDTDDDGNYDVDKPDGTAGTYWVNCPVATPTDGKGNATNRFPTIVAYDDAETPAVDEEWGPVADSWLLTKTGTGFRILGGATGGLVRVDKIGGSGSGDSSTLGKQYLVVQPIGKATSCAEADWYTSGTGYERDETTGLFNRDAEIPLVNSTFWAYVPGSLVKDLGGGFLVGLCSPAPGAWADDPE